MKDSDQLPNVQLTFLHKFQSIPNDPTMLPKKQKVHAHTHTQNQMHTYTEHSKSRKC